jgi:hypothetical protein
MRKPQHLAVAALLAVIAVCLTTASVFADHPYDIDRPSGESSRSTGDDPFVDPDDKGTVDPISSSTSYDDGGSISFWDVIVSSTFYRLFGYSAFIQDNVGFQTSWRTSRQTNSRRTR